VTFSTEPDAERAALVRESLRLTNLERSPELRAAKELYGEDDEPLEIYALDGETFLGGLVAHTWLGWLHVDLLWVRDQGGGLGTELMERAEETARTRGCTASRLETFSFQAPDFYRSRGYRVVGEIPGYPPGATEYILIKQL
jgi:GNAT superfamily N-acetyltransferase